MAAATVYSNKMAVVWVDPTTNEAGGVVFLSPSELNQASRVGCLENHLKSKLPLPFRSKSSLKMHGQELKCQDISAYLPLLRTDIPRFVLSTRTLPLLISPPSGQTVTVWVNPARTVEHMKREISAALGIPPPDQRLLCNGRELRGHRLIESAGLKSYSTVQLAMRLSGGGGGMTKLLRAYKFANLTQDDLLVQVPLTTDGPDWLTVECGLSIESDCTNADCVAFNNEVISPQHFDAFNLTAHKVVCPMCSCQCIPRTCGFYECKWRFEGVLHGSGMHISSEWTDASNDMYHVFDCSEATMVKWLTLVVSVRPVDVEECPVCFEPLCEDIQRLAPLPCKHPVHRSCMDEWDVICKMQNQNPTTCPTCRAPVSS
ncbi:unnamed protein product [Aphanomyces euteiches]